LWLVRWLSPANSNDENFSMNHISDEEARLGVQPDHTRWQAEAIVQLGRQAQGLNPHTGLPNVALDHSGGGSLMATSNSSTFGQSNSSRQDR